MKGNNNNMKRNKSRNNDRTMIDIDRKQGRMHGNPVADAWTGAVMRKPLGIQKCDLPTDGRTDRPTDGQTKV